MTKKPNKYENKDSFKDKKAIEIKYLRSKYND